MLPAAKKTKKKFYNKYIYKVTLNLPGVSSLRYYSLSELFTIDAEQFADTKYPWKYETLKKFKNNEDAWFSLETILHRYNKKEWQKRIEGEYVDFYTNNIDLYNDLCTNFPTNVAVRYQPKKGLENELLNLDKVIFVSKLPHDKYNYKVFLTPHKISSYEEKKSIVDWFQTKIPSITFTDSIKRWVLETTQNFDRRYIYVDSEQTLLLLKLRAPMLVGSVYNYIKTDK